MLLRLPSSSGRAPPSPSLPPAAGGADGPASSRTSGSGIDARPPGRTLKLEPADFLRPLTASLGPRCERGVCTSVWSWSSACTDLPSSSMPSAAISVVRHLSVFSLSTKSSDPLSSRASKARSSEPMPGVHPTSSTTCGFVCASCPTAPKRPSCVPSLLTAATAAPGLSGGWFSGAL